MRKLSRGLAVALLAASIPATIVVAQQAEEPAQPAVERSERDNDSDGDRGRGPSAETLARLEDGRIAMAKAALKLSAEQEKLWAPVEEKIRARFAERTKAREERREKRAERRAKRAERTAEGEKREKPTLPERLEKRSERMIERANKMTERAAKVKEFAEVLKPFYASLSDEQKEVAAHVLGRFIGDGGRRDGRRWASHGRHGKRWN